MARSCRTLVPPQARSPGTHVHAIDLPAPLGAIVATTDPRRLVVAARNGLWIIGLDGKVLHRFADPENERDEIAYNDCKTDRNGRLWVGTHHLAESDARSALWSLASDGGARLADAGFVVSNGPAVSADGTTLYFNDSVGLRTLAYDLSPDDAGPRNSRVFATFPAEARLPDGATVDNAGCLWVGHWGEGRVSRLSPDGALIGTLRLPCPNVTSVAFAGADLRHLVVTTARDGLSAVDQERFPLSDRVFIGRSAVAGLAEPLFVIGGF